jgi:hypothetical protein
MLDQQNRVREILARYRDGVLGDAPVIDRVTVRVGRLAALVPHEHVRRAEEILRAADDFGLVPARALGRLFPGDSRAARAAHVRTALGWLGAHLTAV